MHIFGCHLAVYTSSMALAYLLLFQLELLREAFLNCLKSCVPLLALKDESIHLSFQRLAGLPELLRLHAGMKLSQPCMTPMCGAASAAHWSNLEPLHWTYLHVPYDSMPKAHSIGLPAGLPGEGPCVGLCRVHPALKLHRSFPLLEPCQTHCDPPPTSQNNHCNI